MFVKFLSVDTNTTMVASGFRMLVLHMLLKMVDVDHFIAVLTLFDVSPAVGEVAVDFGLGEGFSTVFTQLNTLHVIINN